MKSKGYGFLLPLTAVLIGGYWLYASAAVYGLYSRSGPDTGFYPAIVAGGLVIVGLVLLFAGGDESPGKFRPVQLLPVVGMLFTLLLGHVIGTVPALFAFLFVWIARVAKYSARTALLVSCVTTFVIWLVFRYAVSVSFQDGILWELFR